MLKLIKHWWLGLLFKVKQSLPEPPPKQFQTTDQPGLLGLANNREFEDRSVQEQSQWFHKANDLRDAIFDLHPVWKNGVGPIVQTSLGIYEAGLRDTDVYPNAVPQTKNLWSEKENPKKNYPLSLFEARRMDHRIAMTEFIAANEFFDQSTLPENTSYDRMNPDPNFEAYDTRKDNHDTHNNQHTQADQHTNHSDSTHNDSDSMGDNSSQGDD